MNFYSAIQWMVCKSIEEYVGKHNFKCIYMIVWKKEKYAAYLNK